MGGLSVDTIAGYLTATVAILAAVGTIYKLYLHPLLMNAVSACKKMIKTALDAASIHDIIRKELSTNGGSSLKDCIIRIEKKMFVQDSKHRAMLSLLERPVWEADERGMFVWVNRAFIKILGRDIEDIKDNGWISIIHAEDRDRVSDEWADSVAQNRTFFSRYRMVKANGDVIHCLGEAFPIESVDHSGHNVSKRGFIGVLSSGKF